ncbi:MAG: hypothetical protein M0C28_38970 [Candidatus Moduliflexus flocculans]|nr:hypothetical protein [Candidatus Moduliflexus flocculans]
MALADLLARAVAGPGRLPGRGRPGRVRIQPPGRLRRPALQGRLQQPVLHLRRHAPRRRRRLGVPRHRPGPRRSDPRPSSSPSSS